MIEIVPSVAISWLLECSRARQRPYFRNLPSTRQPWSAIGLKMRGRFAIVR